MPYGGERNQSQVAKIERCVQRIITSQGKDKESAIRICKAQVLGPRRRSKSGNS